MRHIGSGSEMGRLMVCTAAGVLDRVGNISPQSDTGSGMHAFFRDVQEHGRDEALARVAPELLERAELVDVASLLPPGAETLPGEVALVYDAETEQVRFLGYDIGRNYSKDAPLGPNEIPMSLDVVTLSPGHAFIGDFKTGRGKVPPARRNWQLKLGALAVCRWKGLDCATTGIIHVPESGQPYTDEAVLDGFDLDSIAADVRLMAKRIRAARESKNAPKAVTGEHCRYCPSFQFCPAQTALVRRLAADPKELTTEILGQLSAGEVSVAYRRFREIQSVVKAMGESFYAYANQHAIDVGDGWVYGAKQTEAVELDAEKTWAILEIQHGRDIARAAMTLETSKAGVGRAMRIVQQEMGKAGQKVTLKELNEKALAAIAKAGGMQTKTKTRVEEHKTAVPEEVEP